MQRPLTTVLIVLFLSGVTWACDDDPKDTLPDTTDSTSTDVDTTEDSPQGDVPNEDVVPDVEPDTSVDVEPDVVTASPEAIALADALDADRYEQSIRFVAEIRAPGSPHWQAVQDRCAEVFDAAGFAVERYDYGTGVNVIGVLPGTTKSEEFVVISGHYDHVPGCIGADDNAAGTGGVLEAAQILGGANRYERTLVLACWDQEEGGLVGSKAWAARHARQGRSVHASYVLDTMAYTNNEPNTQVLPTGFNLIFAEGYKLVEDNEFRGDFITAIGDDINAGAVDQFIVHAERLGLPVVPVVLSESLRYEAPRYVKKFEELSTPSQQATADVAALGQGGKKFTPEELWNRIRHWAGKNPKLTERTDDRPYESLSRELQDKLETMAKGSGLTPQDIWNSLKRLGADDHLKEQKTLNRWKLLAGVR